MNDLISRQAAIDALNDEITITGKENAVAVQDYIRRVNLRLHDLPSAEPEHKKGEWVDFTICDEVATKELCGVCGTWSLGMAKNFCPNCGSYNGGETDETD